MRRSHALAGGMLAAALAAAAGPFPLFAVVLAATVLSAALPRRWVRAGGPRAVLAAGAWLLAARVAAGAAAAPHGEETTAVQARHAELSAAIETVTRQASGRQSALLDVPGAGLAYAQLPRYPEFAPGDRIVVGGTLEPLPAAPPPELEGWVGYLRRAGVRSTIAATSARLERRGEDPGARLAQLRAVAGDLLGEALPEPQAGLAAGILVGLRERVDSGLARDFTAAGLTHVVAISGWNIAIVAATCGALARRLSRRRRGLVIGAVVAAYTLFAGASPSVVRAALMAGVALLGREAGRRVGASRALAVAVALMLLVEPGSVLDPGFQLSAVATAGLITWATPLGERIGRAVPALPGALREALAVSLAAQATTLPLVLLDFGRLSLIAPLANLVTAPLVPFAMAGAALALPVGALLAAGTPPLLLTLPLALASLPLAALVAVARAAAAVPYASLTLPGPLAALGAGVAASCLAAVILLARSRRGSPAR